LVGDKAVKRWKIHEGTVNGSLGLRDDAGVRPVPPLLLVYGLPERFPMLQPLGLILFCLAFLRSNFIQLSLLTFMIRR